MLNNQIRISGSSYERSRTNPIANLDPHYTNPRFKHGQTTYLDSSCRLIPNGETVEGASYDYSDRICGWFSREEQDLAHHEALKVNPNPRTAEYIEAYLSSLYQDSGLKLVHIISGVNVSNGHPYRVYGYIKST